VATTPLRISARCNPPGTDPAGVPKTGTASRSRSSASLHGVVFDFFWSRSWSLEARRADCSAAEIRRSGLPLWRIYGSRFNPPYCACMRRGMRLSCRKLLPTQ
jgi:hypothetical protein